MKDFKPKWIAWEITQRCNLSCVHCRSASDSDASRGIFTLERSKELIDEISRFCQPVVVLTGGEPLMHKNVFEIAEYGTDRGFRMCLATNGVPVNDEICEKIKDSGIKIVSLSLDGSTAEIHDNFRNQEGAFEGTIQAAKTLKKHNIEFIINSSFTRRNQEDIPEVYKLAKELGATAWYMFMIVPTGRGEELMEELISADDYDEILEWHYETDLEEEDMLVRPTCAPHYYRISLQKSAERGDGYERRDLKFSTGGGKGCVAAQYIALIDCHGEVKPCSYFLRSAGNIQDRSFKDIWENSKIFKDLRDFDSYKGRCGACEFLNVCGGCRARADAVHGDYMETEPYCSYIPKKIGED